MAVEVDLSVALDRLSGSRYRKARVRLAQQVAKDSARNINSRSGTLAASVEVASDGSSVSFTAPYARRVFYTSKQGSRHFFQQARAVNGQKWADLLRDEMTK